MWTNSGKTSIANNVQTVIALLFKLIQSATTPPPCTLLLAVQVSHVIDHCQAPRWRARVCVLHALMQRDDNWWFFSHCRSAAGRRPQHDVSKCCAYYWMSPSIVAARSSLHPFFLMPSIPFVLSLWRPCSCWELQRLSADCVWYR